MALKFHSLKQLTTTLLPQFTELGGKLTLSRLAGHHIKFAHNPGCTRMKAGSQRDPRNPIISKKRTMKKEITIFYPWPVHQSLP